MFFTLKKVINNELLNLQIAQVEIRKQEEGKPRGNLNWKYT